MKSSNINFQKYSRQIYTYGSETIEKISQLRIYVQGLKGVR